MGGFVSSRTWEAMATATTKTTTAVASTTAAIVARNHSRSLLIRNTANNANAWTLRISLVPTAKGVVVRRNTKAMATATTKTTTAVASTMAVIAARKHSRRQLTKNTAKSVSAWIRRANKHVFVDTKFFLEIYFEILMKIVR